MFSKILIANRGEIAVRVIRACRELGVATVAVYSEADREALHVQLADEAVCIGPATAADSYLNMPSILSATVLTGAEAIHPGYGFLAENAKFARMCAKCNIVFIGPPPEAMERMGHKMAARAVMIAAGVPVVPGSPALLSGAEEAEAVAAALGYPVMIKAAAGGGGRGIRRVDRREDLPGALASAQAEAMAAFGDGGCYLEKLVERARHIEFQIMCDAHGNAAHLFERDCSVQRRRQKLIEEAPGVGLDEDLRAAMGASAVAAARACGYRGAGTVEFLLDGPGRYYFMEMNARIQVEHPVTEQLTGVDLVREQLRVACGEPLSFAQGDLVRSGHVIECRINAEDPDKGFSPSCGKATVLHLPGGPGVRIDSLLYSGVTVPPYYDSMIAKVIVSAPTREEAVTRMRRALGEISVEGVATNVDYQLELLADPAFLRGGVHTGWLEER